MLFRSLQPGARFLLTGTPVRFRNALQIVHPELTDLASPGSPPDGSAAEDKKSPELGRVRVRYPEVDQATLEQAELILLSSEPFPFAEKHRAEMIKETGLPAERFRLVDGQLLSWHGARTLEGLDYAERALG